MRADTTQWTQDCHTASGTGPWKSSISGMEGIATGGNEFSVIEGVQALGRAEMKPKPYESQATSLVFPEAKTQRGLVRQSSQCVYKCDVYMCVEGLCVHKYAWVYMCVEGYANQDTPSNLCCSPGLGSKDDLSRDRRVRFVKVHGPNL